MGQFSMGGAWSKGVGFFSPQAANHAIILIGVGILVPFLLQLLVPGAMAGMMNPLAMGQGGLGALTALGGTTIILLMAVTYVLQIGSYFGSWRIGLGAGENLAGAILFGMVAALLAVILFALLLILFGVLAGQASPALGAIGFMVTIFVLLAVLYTAMAALFAVFMFLMFLIILAFGASMADAEPALALFGGGGVLALIGLVLTALLLWLSARFSCATCVMADRKTFNFLTGLGESWRLTADHQWRIMAYLGLLGIVLAVVFFVAAIVVGAGVAGGLQGGADPQLGIGAIVVALIVSIPLAYLMVLVPAGIYRELSPPSSAEVFA